MVPVGWLTSKAVAKRGEQAHNGDHARPMATLRPVADADQPLEEQLEEIRIQLDWVRDYL